MEKLKTLNNRVVAKALTKRESGILAKHPGAKEIIVELGLAAIAVALLILFRDQISTLVTTVMGDATTKIQEMFGTI